jgi:hypothetical protein
LAIDDEGDRLLEGAEFIAERTVGVDQNVLVNFLKKHF